MKNPNKIKRIIYISLCAICLIIAFFAFRRYFTDEDNEILSQLQFEELQKEANDTDEQENVVLVFADKGPARQYDSEGNIVTPTPAPTKTPTPTPITTPTDVPVPEPVGTETAQPTVTPTYTPSPVPTDTPTPTSTSMPVVEKEITVPAKNLDWDKLYKTNEHIYCWIYIPGTKVDYPVVQHPYEADYYLLRNLNLTEGYPGTLFTQFLNHKDFNDPNTIIYGHNMMDDSMFGTLHEFQDRDFFDANRYVFIYTPEKTFVYEIFSAVMFTENHLLYEYKFKYGSEKLRFVKDLSEVRSMTNNFLDVNVTESDKLLTLSTCSNSVQKGRYIVVAKLLGSVENDSDHP